MAKLAERDAHSFAAKFVLVFQVCELDPPVRFAKT